MTSPQLQAHPLVILPTEAAAALEEIGLSVEILHRALLAGETGAGNVGKFHPVGAAGSVRWFDIVGQLRQELNTQHKWKLGNPKNSPRIVHPDRTMAIMIVQGDEDTGNPANIHPGTARKRGAATDDAVSSNQLSLFDVPDEVVPVTPDVPTWVLLYFRSEDPSEIRAELSFPVAIDDGEITLWQKRIVIESIPIDVAVQPQDAGGEDVNFDVRPREQ
jgi:hypothetical protein